MVMINRATKEITLKIVYYGPGLCGKTTNLEFIYAKANPEKRGKLLTVATETDRTLFFDFLPMELGTILGMKLRVQLYTVPGQVFYDATRRIVLRGSDGVVFVADSQKLMMDANWESLENMKKNLVLNNMNPDILPLVFQYNKRDLPNLATVEELNQALNWRGVPNFEAVATAGRGVNETVRKIIEMVIRRLHEQEVNLKHPQRAAEVPPSPVSVPPPTPPEVAGSELPVPDTPAPPPVPSAEPPSLEDTSEEMAGVEVETEFSVEPEAVPQPPEAQVEAQAGTPEEGGGSMGSEPSGAVSPQPPSPADFPLIEMPAKVEPLPELEEATGNRPVMVMEGPELEPVTEDLPASAVESEEVEILPEAAIQVEDIPEFPSRPEVLSEVAEPAEEVPAPDLPEVVGEVEVSSELEELPAPSPEFSPEGAGAGEVRAEVSADESASPTPEEKERAAFSRTLDEILQQLRGILTQVEDLKARMADFEDRLGR